ncbi:unnamed protein product [Effrenium voratum]|nr:unnamed protein product [Effrenium voratum]
MSGSYTANFPLHNCSKAPGLRPPCYFRYRTMSVNSTFSSSAPAFAPAGMQQAYYYGYSYNYYHTAQCQAYASSPVNLDDFSDLSDSDTEEPKKAPPSPISRSAQRLDTEPEPLPEPRQLESDTSSISSEPEKEVDDELDASSTMSMDEVEFEEKTIYSVHELLQCRSKLHQESPGSSTRLKR